MMPMTLRLVVLAWCCTFACCVLGAPGVAGAQPASDAPHDPQAPAGESGGPESPDAPGVGTDDAGADPDGADDAGGGDGAQEDPESDPEGAAAASEAPDSDPSSADEAPSAAADDADPDADARPVPAVVPPAAQRALAGDDDDDDEDDDDEGEHSRHRVRYYLEAIEVEGNTRTSASVIRRYVSVEVGEAFDPEEDDLETVRYGLMGTGWFDSVDIRLRRGAERGWVIMVLRVRERNTVVIEQIALGVSEGVRSQRSTGTRLNPYVGASVADTNLLGRGFRLSVSGLVSALHQGGRVSFTEPHLFGSSYALTIAPFFNNSRQYFGRDPLVSTRCDVDAPDDCLDEIRARNAVVFYRRGGFRLGTGRYLGGVQFNLSWQAEWVRVTSRPEAASELRGTEVRPIDFSIDDGRSFVSVLRISGTYDRRDDPGVPTRGTYLRAQADAGTRLLGSEYDFLRLQVRLRQWVPLPHGHTIRFSGFAGIVFGDAPFFYKFHASDLSDLIPSRVLEMELDRRPPPNLLGTAVAFMRNEEVAFRLDIEYGMPLMRRRRGGFRGLQLYFGVGLYALADIRDLRFPVPGFDGAARLPVDLTFDVGLRADTSVGVFTFGFSNLLGFIDP